MGYADLTTARTCAWVRNAPLPGFTPTFSCHWCTLTPSNACLFLPGNPEPAIAMLSAALSGVWPPSKAMQRRLVAGQFVPAAEVEEEHGKGSGEADAAATGSSAAAGTAAGEGAGPNSSGRNHDEGPSTSTAAAGDQPAGAAQQGKEEAEEEEEPSQVAAALGAALEQHCPGFCLADVQKAALCLRLFLGCRAVGEQASDGPNFQVCDGVALVQLLLRARLLLLLLLDARLPC